MAGISSPKWAGAGIIALQINLEKPASRPWALSKTGRSLAGRFDLVA